MKSRSAFSRPLRRAAASTRVLERLGGLGVVEHVLERLLHPQRLADLLHRRVVGVSKDVRFRLGRDQKILEFLPRHRLVAALGCFLEMLIQ